MPQYGTKEELRKLQKKHWCSICGGRLGLVLDVGRHEFFIACSDFHRTHHEGITSHNKGDEKYMKEFKERYKMDSKSLMTMNETQMLARVDMAKFPQDLTVADKRLLAQVAITYGFDPLMGEVSIYQGKPWVSIDGRYRKAQETEKLDGVDTRPATKQERIDWQIPDGDYFFRAEIYVKGSSHPFVGWGRVFTSETVGGKGFKPVEKNPQRMAEKRAEAQGLRKGFHIPLPSYEDIGSPDIEGNSHKVNRLTGEVIEGEYREKTAPEQPKPQDSADNPPAVTQHTPQVQSATASQSEAIKAYTEANPPANIGELKQWVRDNLKDKKASIDKYIESCGVRQEQLKDIPRAFMAIKQISGW